VILVGSVGCGRVAEQLRNLDWDVQNLPITERLICAVLARKPAAVVLPIATGRESGYLLAAKLRAGKKKPRVVLVAPSRTADAEHFAKFVGAALITEKDEPSRFVQAVAG
jgi:DNA-binding LytR/AlgR family response regulator